MPLGAALLSAGLALAGPALGRPAAHLDASVRAPADTTIALAHPVPFLAQGPLLCGGAAAAMVQRFWGERGIWAEDFAGLVRPDEGGIRTGDLSRALQTRGYRTESHRGDGGALARALRSGTPPIVLLDAGAKSLHYVVVVGVDADGVLLHDPAVGPDRRLALEEFSRRWAAADRWTLVVRPRPAGPTAAPVQDAPDPPESDPHSPLIDRGLAQLRSGDFAAARATARALLSDPGPPDLGWRMLATARYLDGDAPGALDAWNRLSEPRIDLVRVEGLRATRYPVALDRIGLPHGTVLTASRLSRARRRLDDVPALHRTRLDYRPLPDGSVEVTAAVVERPRWPFGTTALATAAVGAVVDRRATLGFGALLGAGDRWTLDAAWDRALSGAALRVRTPAPPLPGIVTVTLEGKRARFQGPGGAEREGNARAGVEVSEWITGGVRLSAGAALERWTGTSRTGAGSLLLELRPGGDDLRLVLSGDGHAGGSARFGRVAFDVGARVPRGPDDAWTLDGGMALASDGTPRLLWWGAGAGRFGRALLRGHPLVVDDVIAGPALGRGLMHASLERVRYHRVGPLRFGGAVFVDAARAWRDIEGGSSATLVDFGAGLRLALDGRTARVDLARGGGTWVISAQVGTEFP